MPGVPAASDVRSRITDVLERVGQWWLQASWPTQVALLGVVLLLKNGLGTEMVMSRDAYLPAAVSFPQPTAYYSASTGNLALAKLLGITTLREWLVLHGVLVLIALGVAVVLAARSSLGSRAILLLILASSSAVATLPQVIGKYDPVTLIGACLLVLARRRWTSALGALVMALGNPEQAVLAALCLLLLSWADEFRSWRTRAILALVVAAAFWAVVQAWLVMGGVSSRLGVLGYHLGLSLGNFLTAPGAAVWSWLGVGWLVALGLLVVTHGLTRYALGASLIAVPAVATLLTADGARVFGLIVLPALVVASAWFWKHFSSSERGQRAGIGAYLILWILVPALLGGWGSFGWILAESVRSAVASWMSGI